MDFDPDGIDPVTINVDIDPYSLSRYICDESGETIDGPNVVVVWTAETMVSPVGPRVRPLPKLGVRSGFLDWAPETVS